LCRNFYPSGEALFPPFFLLVLLGCILVLFFSLFPGHVVVFFHVCLPVSHNFFRAAAPCFSPHAPTPSRFCSPSSVPGCLDFAPDPRPLHSPFFPSYLDKIFFLLRFPLPNFTLDPPVTIVAIVFYSCRQCTPPDPFPGRTQSHGRPCWFFPSRFMSSFPTRLPAFPNTPVVLDNASFALGVLELLSRAPREPR